MESELAAQETRYESGEINEPREIGRIKITKKSDIGKSGASGLLVSLIPETREQTLTRNIINNFVMHIH